MWMRLLKGVKELWKMWDKDSESESLGSLYFWILFPVLPTRRGLHNSSESSSTNGPRASEAASEAELESGVFYQYQVLRYVWDVGDSDEGHGRVVDVFWWVSEFADSWEGRLENHEKWSIFSIFDLGAYCASKHATPRTTIENRSKLIFFQFFDFTDKNW